MKNIMDLRLIGLGATMVLGGVLTSCTNTLDDPHSNLGNNDLPQVSLVKTPDFVVWSGNQIIGNTKSTRSADVNGNLWYQNWDRPTNVTEEEIAKVLEAVKNPIYKHNDIKIDWENYWVQQVYTGTATYNDGYGNNIGTGASHMNHLLAYSSKVNEQTSWWPEPEFTLRDKYPYENVYEHINNFNSGSNNTVYTDDVTQEQFIGTTLMTGMYSEDVDAQHQFGYHNSTDSKDHFEYIIIEVDGEYYVCFDFYATHPDGQDANKNMDVERDHIYNDWIVKISPAYPVGTTPEPGEGGNEKPGVTPEIPIVHGHGNEVEVNYEIMDSHDYEIADLVTKLSIHVRHATDVDIRIPVPNVYVIESDDLYIFNEHYDGKYDGTGTDKPLLHNQTASVTHTIAGQTVTLTVEFLPDSDGGYIHISTTGINETLIKYCETNFGDGINFEVYNYYRTATEPVDDDQEFVNDLTREKLKGFLDKSTISFTDEPVYYINAFGWDYVDDTNGSQHYDTINPDDCYVTPGSSYETPYWGIHLNGTPHNYIYVKKGFAADELHSAL